MPSTWNSKLIQLVQKKFKQGELFPQSADVYVSLQSNAIAGDFGK